MKDPVVFRKAVETDYEIIHGLMEADLRFHRQNRPDYFKEGVEAYTMSEFQELLALPSSIAWVAERETQPVGLCFGKIGPSKEGALFSQRRVALIEDLFVTPECRGMGIATALLERVREQAVAEGAQSLELCVWGFNEGARRLYQRFGMDVQYIRMEQRL